MRILLATTVITLNGGGIASYNNELLTTLKTNNRFHLLTTEHLSCYPGFEKIYTVSQFSFKKYSDYRLFIDLINEEQYDLILNSDSSIISVVAPFLKSPIITISHTFNNVPAIEAGFNYKYVNKVIALSAAGKKFIEDYFAINDKSKVSYIYNFIRSDEKCMSEQKSVRRVLSIVFPGGSSMMKHPEMVLMAVKKLLKTDLIFKFYWLGNTTLPIQNLSLPKNINELTEQDDRLVFTGKIERDVALKYIKDANVFILPSRAEGCPMSLIEALSTGCIPVVGDAKHVCREILEDGHFGVIVKQGSSEDLFEKLVSIIENHENYVDNYTATFNYSKSVLSEDIWLQKMQDTINEALSTKKACLPLSALNLLSSLFRFSFHSHKMLVKERLLSVWGLVFFNYMYFKQRKP